MDEKRYPSWIDEYEYSIHRAYSGMVSSSWSSLDGLKAYRAQEGVSFLRLDALRAKHEKLGTTPKELFKLFSTASTVRCEILYLSWEYAKISDKTAYTDAARRVFDWLAAILSAGMLEDEWVRNKNVTHSPAEVSSMLSATPWIEGNVEAARNAGKVYVSAAAMAFALYRDFFPQEAHEVYGPYDASARYGADTTLLVKHFPKLRPVELWSEVKDFPYEEVTIYQVLKNVHFRCEFVGMHSLYDGPVIPNTVATAVAADGKFIPADEMRQLADVIATRATEYSHLYEKLDLPAAKRKFAEWEMYQANRVFKAAGIDWRPTEPMLSVLSEADIPMGITLDSFPPYEEYVSSPEYEPYWLKKLYTDTSSTGE